MTLNEKIEKEPVLRLAGLTKRFGGIIATDHLDFDVRAGEIHGLIGPNGAGKSTLVAQIQGNLRPDEGSITFEGRDITVEAPHRRAKLGVARSFQITSVFMGFTMLANVMMAVQAQAGHSMWFWKNTSMDSSLIDPAMELLELVGLTRSAQALAQNVSYGERRQLELAMALAMKPKLLLLDEPMAGMGRQDGGRMISLLETLKGRYSILLVEHDMDAVFTLSDRISVLVAGRCIATGSPEKIKSDAGVRDAYLGHKST